MITYPEGGIAGTVLRQKQTAKPRSIDNIRVQLIPTRPVPTIKLNSPEDVAKFAKEMENYDREYAKIIFLDTKNQVIGTETISIGSLSASIVHPREALKGAILSSSASTIFLHNHPSGICEPSNEDIEISGRLKEAFETVGIVLLDSIIVGKGCYYSLRETGFISGKMETRVKTVEEPHINIVSERRTPVRGMYPGICQTCRVECVICPHYVNPEKKVHKFVGIRKIADKIPTVKESVSEQPLRKYIKAYNEFASHEEAGLRTKLDKVSVCTGKPITESQVMGAATPMNGHLMGFHLTDNPDEALRRLQSDNLVAMNPHGDLGGGLYISSVPDYWRVRSQRKWDFAKNLTKAQRQNLVNVILADPRYRKGGGYIADFEVDRLNRDLNMYVESGDVTYLVITGNQPYNVSITADLTRKAGVPEPKEPGLVEVTLSGKFIDAAGLYTNPLRDEVINRARAWGMINKPELMGFTLNTKNVVNAWLDSMGYSGMFTRSGMGTNPEMVIWDRKAIVSFRKVV